MEWSTVVEVFGYLASLTVIFSLTRTSVKKLWTINMIGGIGFIIFALITKSYPTALMNVGAVIIDIVQLYRLSHVQTSFELVEAEPDSIYYKWYMDKHHDELAELSPDFGFSHADKQYYYLCNNEVAGLLAFTRTDDDRLRVDLDFVGVKYRDCQIGRYFFGSESPFLKSLGIKKVFTYTDVPHHQAYLRQMQFHHTTDNVWEKDVTPTIYRP